MLARKVLTVHKPERDRELLRKLFDDLPGPVRRTTILDNHLIDDLTSENNPLQKRVMCRQGIVNRHQASYSNPLTSSHRIAHFPFVGIEFVMIVKWGVSTCAIPCRHVHSPGRLITLSKYSYPLGSMLFMTCRHALPISMLASHSREHGKWLQSRNPE